MRTPSPFHGLHGSYCLKLGVKQRSFMPSLGWPMIWQMKTSLASGLRG